MSKDNNISLLKKYNLPVPRYTSYPTVPYWQNTPPTQEEWKSHLHNSFQKNPELALYIHLPFCESLCTYCGCNTRITKNHAVEMPYVETLLQEWKLYLQVFDQKPTVKEIHLGGGTPTFFQAKNLDRLLRHLLMQANVAEQHEFSLEVHPATTTKEHLIYLSINGFKRISVGVQDFDEAVLNIINRKQTYEQVVQVTEYARALGYTSVNYDLIYGLPKQTIGHIERTMAKVQELRPDRIAFYSYAHVPWLKKGQRAYSEADLPTGAAKLALYERGRELLEDMGYVEIGMDHFALPEEELTLAQKSGALHRNFMGYTTNDTKLLVALGTSSISDTWDAYAQNEKHLETYKKRVLNNEFPIMRGHRLTKTDEVVRRHILNIMCLGQTSWNTPEMNGEVIKRAMPLWNKLATDGLVEVSNKTLKVTEKGRPFLRNISLALDYRYWDQQPENQLFSQAV